MRTVLLVTVCLLHVGFAYFLAADMFLAGLSSVIEVEQAGVFYLTPKTGLTYDRAYQVADQFEWHRERVMPYSLRMEELYLFFFQLLLL